MRNARLRILAWIPFLAALASLMGGCGYRMGEVTPDIEPSGASGIRIVVPIFENLTFEPLLERQAADAIKEELITRGWNVVNRAQDADAVLRGKILAFELIPLSLDPQGQVLEYRVHMTVSMVLTTPPPSSRLIWSESAWEENSDFRASSDPAVQRINEDRSIREACGRLGVRLSRKMTTLSISSPAPGSK
ncbi:MAG TPA: LptE family protein [Nitrospiria bacterium]|nr:LptE family protein [Nitrospiria bacterium]